MTSYHIYRGCKIDVTERPNFWDADIHYGMNTWLYAYVSVSKIFAAENLLENCRKVIDEGIDTGFIFKGRQIRGNPSPSPFTVTTNVDYDPNPKPLTIVITSEPPKGNFGS